MKQILLMIAVVALVGCGEKEETAEAEVATEVIAAAKATATAEAKAVDFDALKVEAAKPAVVGYLPHYRGNIINKLPVEKFTDVIFFSISPKPDGSLDTSRVKPALLAKLVGLAHAKGTRVHICIGGWNLSAGFSAMTANANARAAFVHNLVKFIRKHQLQGADFDWEHPENAREMANYHRLLIEVKKVFVPDQLWLSIAVIDFAKHIKPRNLGAARERWRAVIPFIDRFHVMAYDQGTPHAPFAGAVGALSYWEILQVPKTKLVLGLPFYGRSARGKAATYSQIVQRHSPKPNVDEAGGFHFNGPVTIRRKTEFVLQQEYGGVMIWEISQDSAGPTSLLDAVHAAIRE
jgi:hypothetical protein